MKRRILCMLLVLVLAVSACGILASCGECEHPNIGDVAWTKKDARNHERKCPDCDFADKAAHVFISTSDPTIQKCRDCDATKTVDPNAEVDMFQVELEEKMASYPWSKQDIVMSLNNNSNNSELPSGSMAFVSGEWSTSHASYSAENTVTRVSADVLAAVKDRNAASASAANVNVTYKYATAGWSAVLGMITEEAKAGGTPDVYYNFVYDMVGASINGLFKDVFGNEYLGTFYDSYGDGTTRNILTDTVSNTRGYAWDFMKQLTFSTERMYLIASDYSFDLARAFFIMPVNGTLLATATSVTGDVNGDGEINEVDFYAMVDNGDWTWTKLAEYTNAIKTENSGGGYAVTGDCKVGYFIAKGTGLPTTAFMYSAGWDLVQRTIGDEGEYVYSYPDDAGCQGLIDTFIAMKTFVGDPGVSSTSGVLLDSYLSNATTLFTDDRAFVNASCVVGKLEDEAYSDMWDDNGNGFLVAPYAKVLADQEEYRTVVHNVGKVFAISSKATEDVTNAACAFINHQTIASTDILGTYFLWSLGKDTIGSDLGVRVLANLTNNLSYNLDKIVEDAIGIMYGSTSVVNPASPSGANITLSDARWHVYDYTAWNKGENVSGFVTEITDSKAAKLVEIQEKFIGTYADE